MGLNPHIVIGFHLIGSVIALIIFYKIGEFEAAAKYGDGIRTATPSDVVFHALVLWEFLLFLFVIVSIENAIDEFFRNKYIK